MTIFTHEEIEEDPLVKEFLGSRPIKYPTIKNYLMRFWHYSNFTGISPTELIEEAEAEEEQKIRSRHRKIKKYLNDFTRYLETVEYAPGKKYSETTIGRSITDIKTFYHYFDIDTPKVNLKDENSPRRDDLPTMDEIKKALRNVTTRDKALILLHLSSGMAAREVREFKTSDLIKGLGIPENTPLEDLRSKIPENPIPDLWIIRVKENVEYVTFCSPQCVYAIVDYLEEKGSYSEYLFPGRNGQMAEPSHTGIFKRINDKLGFGWTANGKQRRFMPHKLRAVFGTNMYSSGVDWTKIDQMLGHKPNKITRSYRRPPVDIYKEAYIEGLDSITTDKINIIDFRSPEMQELTNKNIELESEVKNLKEQQQSKIAEIQRQHKREMAEMQAKMQVQLNDSQNDTKKLILDLFKQSNTSELSSEDLPSQIETLNNLESAVIAYQKEKDEKNK
ncbi:Tyrosine recombinase XerC [anaerobic digester metagenome]